MANRIPCEHNRWQPLYKTAIEAGDRAKRARLKKLGPHAFYQEQLELQNRKIEENRTDDIPAEALHRCVMEAEAAMYCDRVPYFRLWPGICEMMLETDLDLPCDTVNSPFESLEVRLPKILRLPVPTTAMLGCMVKFHGKKVSGRAIVLAVQEQSQYGNYRYHNVSLIPLPDGDSVESVIRGMLEDAEKNIHPGQHREHYNLTYQAYRLLICTLFFGIGQHELVLPDVPRRMLNKYLDAKKIKDRETELRIQGKAKNGFTVGSEIDLPEADIVYHGHRSKGGGMELATSHMRRGHMCWQPCGEGRGERKLIFRAPTVVRPDLPAKPQGYRIGAEL